MEQILVNAREAAGLLGISLSLLKRETATGLIPSVKICRRRMYSPMKLREFAEGQS